MIYYCNGYTDLEMLMNELDIVRLRQHCTSCKVLMNLLGQWPGLLGGRLLLSRGLLRASSAVSATFVLMLSFLYPFAAFAVLVQL